MLNNLCLGRELVIGRLAGSNPLSGCGGVGEWLIPADCKSAARKGYAGSNPAPSTTIATGAAPLVIAVFSTLESGL